MFAVGGESVFCRLGGEFLVFGALLVTGQHLCPLVGSLLMVGSSLSFPLSFLGA